MQNSLTTRGLKYCKCVLIHKYVIILFSHEPSVIMERLSKFYDMKKDPEAKNTYYEPRRYLVANVGKFDLPTSSGTVWFMSGVDYFKKELNSVLEILS